MSLINEYRATEEAIKELQERLQNLNSNDKLKTELEFEKKLRALMAEYGKSLKALIEILDPKAGSYEVKPKGKRAERVVKIYKNPETKETIETKGGNHKILKQWKAKYGADVVESWLQ